MKQKLIRLKVSCAAGLICEQLGTVVSELGCTNHLVKL